MGEAKKTAVAIRHLQFEDLGCFEPALERNDYEVKYHDVGVRPLEELLESPPDLLVVLGGPIGAYEDRTFPFLKKEVDILKARLQKGLPTMGICLGAQLMAHALGSRVYPGPAKEIGFSPLQLTSEGEQSCLRHLDGGRVLHWHGDTFDLPAESVRLASTDLCVNQAFRYGTASIAFQFHPEAGGRGFERWLIGHTVELAAAGIGVSELRAESELLQQDYRETTPRHHSISYVRIHTGRFRDHHRH